MQDFEPMGTFSRGFIYIHMCTYIILYILYMYTYIYVYMYGYVYVRVYVYAYICTDTPKSA